MSQYELNINNYDDTEIILKKSTKSNFKWLNKLEDLEKFQNLAYENIGVRFPISFLKNSQTVAAIDKYGKMYGGFVFAGYKDSRVISSLSSDAMQTLKTKFPDYKNSVFEITGLWLSASERSKMNNIKFWSKLCDEISKIDRPNFIYAYSSSKPQLAKLYSAAKPQRIFQGITKVLPGMTKPDDEVIEIGSVKSCHLAWIMKTSYRYRKIIKKHSHRKNHA